MSHSPQERHQWSEGLQYSEEAAGVRNAGKGCQEEACCLQWAWGTGEAFAPK